MKKIIFKSLLIVFLLGGIGAQAAVIFNACEAAQLAAYNSAIARGLDHDTAADIAHDVYVACNNHQQ
jgi:hypothetical protein